MKAVANSIFCFCTKGRFHGKKDSYIREGLLDIQMESMIREEYALGDIIDYKRAAQKIKKLDEVDIVIAIVPDGMDEDGPYNPFKTIWAEANIPSQMVSIRTAELFANETTASTSKYYLHNIVLGILGKTGGSLGCVPARENSQGQCHQTGNYQLESHRVNVVHVAGCNAVIDEIGDQHRDYNIHGNFADYKYRSEDGIPLILPHAFAQLLDCVRHNRIIPLL